MRLDAAIGVHCPCQFIMNSRVYCSSTDNWARNSDDHPPLPQKNRPARIASQEKTKPGSFDRFTCCSIWEQLAFRPGSVEGIIHDRFSPTLKESHTDRTIHHSADLLEKPNA